MRTRFRTGCDRRREGTTPLTNPRLPGRPAHQKPIWSANSFSSVSGMRRLTGPIVRLPDGGIRRWPIWRISHRTSKRSILYADRLRPVDDNQFFSLDSDYSDETRVLMAMLYLRRIGTSSAENPKRPVSIRYGFTRSYGRKPLRHRSPIGRRRSRFDAVHSGDSRLGRHASGHERS